MQTLLHQHRLTALYRHFFFYIMILAPLCTYYAFKGRNIPENFNETKYIGFSMYILLLSSIAYYPVAFVMIENLYVALVFCLTTLATSFGLSGCMFAHNYTFSSVTSPARQGGIRQVAGVEFLLWQREQELSPSQSMPEYLTPL